MRKPLARAMTILALIVATATTAQAGHIGNTAGGPSFKPGEVYRWAHMEATRLGLSAGSWSCLSALISRENGNTPSRWDPRRWNGGGSGAYGLPQALPGSKMASQGADWEWNPVTQVRWMVSYASKYGGPCGADSYQRAHGYY